jgi:hypothetical protein
MNGTSRKSKDSSRRCSTILGPAAVDVEGADNSAADDEAGGKDLRDLVVEDDAMTVEAGGVDRLFLEGGQGADIKCWL